MNQLLLPPKAKLLGLLLSAMAITLYLVNGLFFKRMIWLLDVPVVAYQEPLGPKQFLTISSVPFYDTFLCLLLLFGMMCITFAKVKMEDEYISSIRLHSWMWAVLVNVGLAFLSYLLFYGMSFFLIITANSFSLLVLFNLRFNYLLYKTSKLKSL